ncbi:terminase small subunit [Acinetobacter sp. GC2]|nr:terminase small subunit [Acinetobacter lwoffii]
MTDLTDKQQRFVDEYLIDLNATQAAIRAGYSEKTADSIGLQLLRKTQVAEAIEEAQNLSKLNVQKAKSLSLVVLYDFLILS